MSVCVPDPRATGNLPKPLFINPTLPRGRRISPTGIQVAGFVKFGFFATHIHLL